MKKDSLRSSIAVAKENKDNRMDRRFLKLRRSNRDGGIEIGMEIVSSDRANNKQKQEEVEKWTDEQWNRVLGHESQEKFNLHIITVPEPLRPVEGNIVRLAINFTGKINRKQYRGLFEIQVFA